MVKWALTALAFAIACISGVALPGTVTAQEDTFVSPTEGEAGSRFQIVGEVGWTPGEIVTIDFAFSDSPPTEDYAGPFYNEQTVTVLRDGTWSFPVVVNRDLFPFPLWRPGYIVVRARGDAQITITPFLYTVEGRHPVGQPPLAGFGPVGSEIVSEVLTLALFAAATGALLIASGVLRGARASVYSSPSSLKNASVFGSRPRKSRTRTSPSTLPPRSRILRR